MKKCNKCGVGLVEGTNVYTSSLKAKDYKCKSCTKGYNKKWIQNNPERHKELRDAYHKKWYAENKDIKAEYQKQYNKENAERRREYQSERRSKYPHLTRWRDLLKRSKNGTKSKSTQELLGYSSSQLKEHLEKLGMDWDKHQVEHKIPVSWFKHNTPPHIVNDLRNLEPITEYENKSKGNRFGSSVSPSYIYIVDKYIKTQYKKKIWQLAL